MGTLLLLSSPFALYAQNKHINLTVYHDGTKYKMGFKDSHCQGGLRTRVVFRRTGAVLR